jgi:RNA polymerase sigma factor (sigma-70 family)
MEQVVSMIRSDEHWVMELKNGNLRGMEFLYTRYYKKVYSKCLTFVKDSEVAKDLAQEIMIKVMEKAIFFRCESKFSTWLYRITVNSLIDQRRRRVLSQAPLSVDMQIPEEETHELEYRDQLLERLHLLLQDSQSDEWKLLQEKYLQQKSIAELTKQYQVSQSAMKMRLLRARQHAAKSIESQNQIETYKS